MATDFYAPDMIAVRREWHVRVTCPTCAGTRRTLDERMGVTVVCGRCHGWGWGYTLTPAAQAQREHQRAEYRRAARYGQPHPDTTARRSVVNVDLPKEDT